MNIDQEGAKRPEANDERGEKEGRIQDEQDKESPKLSFGELFKNSEPEKAGKRKKKNKSKKQR